MAEPNNTPVPSELPASPMTLQSHIASRASSSANGLFERNLALSAASKPKKPIVLHIGDPIKYNPGTYATFSQEFEVIRPSTPERERPEFIRALKERRWGDFSAIFRPFWGTGGEMGKWDAELIDLLPDSVKVFASAGAGFDWADTKLLGEKGKLVAPIHLSVYPISLPTRQRRVPRTTADHGRHHILQLWVGCCRSCRRLRCNNDNLNV